MQTPFDLLRRDPDGSFISIEAAADLVVARMRLRELASNAPGEYVLFDHTNQETIEKFGSPNLSSRESRTSNLRLAKPQYPQRCRYSIIVDAATNFRVWSLKMTRESIALRVTKLR
jgi:hypothetical protein